MVEGAALEKQCVRKDIVGSNPTLSAIIELIFWVLGQLGAWELLV